MARLLVCVFAHRARVFPFFPYVTVDVCRYSHTLFRVQIYSTDEEVNDYVSRRVRTICPSIGRGAPRPTDRSTNRPTREQTAGRFARCL